MRGLVHDEQVKHRLARKEDGRGLRRHQPHRHHVEQTALRGAADERAHRRHVALLAAFADEIFAGSLVGCAPDARLGGIDGHQPAAVALGGEAPGLFAGDGPVEFEQARRGVLQTPERRRLIEKLQVRIVRFRGGDLPFGPAEQHGIGPGGGGAAGQPSRQVFHQHRRSGQDGLQLLHDAVGGTKRVGFFRDGVGQLAQTFELKFDDVRKGLGCLLKAAVKGPLRREQIQRGLAVRRSCRPASDG